MWFRWKYRTRADRGEDFAIKVQLMKLIKASMTLPDARRYLTQDVTKHQPFAFAYLYCLPAANRVRRHPTQWLAQMTAAAEKAESGMQFTIYNQG